MAHASSRLITASRSYCQRRDLSRLIIEANASTRIRRIAVCLKLESRNLDPCRHLPPHAALSHSRDHHRLHHPLGNLRRSRAGELPDVPLRTLRHHRRPPARTSPLLKPRGTFAASAHESQARRLRHTRAPWALRIGDGACRASGSPAKTLSTAPCPFDLLPTRPSHHFTP